MVAPSLREFEYALGDDVELDLGRPALDGVALRSEPVPRQLQVFRRVRRAFPAESRLAGERDEQLLTALVQLRAVHLEEGRLRSGPGAAGRAVTTALHGELEASLVHEQLRGA